MNACWDLIILRPAPPVTVSPISLLHLNLRMKLSKKARASNPSPPSLLSKLFLQPIKLLIAQVVQVLRHQTLNPQALLLSVHSQRKARNLIVDKHQGGDVLLCPSDRLDHLVDD